jgi:hypothetical protein
MDRVSSSRLRKIHERAFARSFEIVRGTTRGVFPDVCGISLGELNLQGIQAYLASFSVLSAAVGDLLEEGEIGACHILSGDVGFARALKRHVAERGRGVSTWPPQWVLEVADWARSSWTTLQRLGHGTAEQAARDAMTAVLVERGLTGARPRALVISESTPMAQMFGVVEDALSRAGVGPVVRLDFGGGSSQAEERDAVVCRCGPQGELGRRGGPLRTQWRAARQELRRYQARATFEDSQEAACLEGLIGRLYASVFDAQARHLWAADAAIELLRPEVVLVGNDRWWGGQTFVQLARRRRIPSVSVQDGLAGDVPFWWWLAADRLAATSEQLTQMLVRHGVAPERCTVTGQPRYDLVARSDPEDQRAARATLGLNLTTFSVLFAVQPIHGPDYVQSVISALLAVPGVHVLLRPHPSDARDLCERLARHYGAERVTLHRAGDSLRLLRACDMLVTENSTVVLEAALLGKPVITAHFGGSLFGPAPFGAAGIATAVYGLDDLTREVQRLVSSVHVPTSAPRSGHTALDALLGPVDGRAGDRVAAVVAEALQRSQVEGSEHPNGT